MEEALNSGTGLCNAEIRVAFSTAMAALHLGAGPDIFAKITSAVHSHNRRAPNDDFIALGFPHMADMETKTNTRFGFNIFGADVDVFGSKKAIDRLMSMKEIETLVSRGMVTPQKAELQLSGGEGTAFVRDRRFEKLSDGFMKRASRRSEKNGRHRPKHPSLTAKAVHKEAHAGFIQAAGGFRVYFVPVKAQIGLSFEVSTYGLSSKSNPAALICTNKNSLRDVSAFLMSLEEM